jgi:hypothetical protein
VSGVRSVGGGLGLGVVFYFFSGWGALEEGTRAYGVCVRHQWMLFGGIVELDIGDVDIVQWPRPITAYPRSSPLLARAV